MATDRRKFLTSTLAAGAALSLGVAQSTRAESPSAPAKRYQEGISLWPLVLNTSTIRPAPLTEKIRIAAETGWDGIELWVNDLEDFEKSGGNLEDLGKEIADKGLFVPNVIGLWGSMPATPEDFETSLKASRNRMRLSAEVGSKCVAAIPTPDRSNFDLAWGAHCYRELMRIGREEFGIRVAFEFVGFFKGISRLGQAVAIALDADDSSACLIADTFHLYRGGSGFGGLKHLQGDLIADFHWNDVPSDIPREQLADKDRILPGDGILPLGQVLQELEGIGYRGPLSLEVFRAEYWEQDPSEVAQLGLRKMRECVAAAGL